MGTFTAYFLWCFLMIFVDHMLTTFANVQDHTAPILIGLVGLLILYIVSKKLEQRFNNRCSECKKWGAMRRVDSQLLRTETISVLVETKRRNLDGNVVGSQDQYIPGTRKVYSDTYQCKFCGAQYKREHTAERASL